MKIEEKNPAREYTVGANANITIKDVGDVYLEADEQLTFVTDAGSRYDFCKKSWGFYATPSINSRLEAENFVTALVMNSQNRLYVMVVDRAKITDFRDYLSKENQKVAAWLGDPF